jgi:hypothetical protein
MLSYVVVLLVVVIVILLWSARNSAKVITRQLYGILETRRGEPQERESRKEDSGDLPDLLRGIHEELRKITLYFVELNKTCLETAIDAGSKRNHILHDLQVIMDQTLSCSHELMKINEEIEGSQTRGIELLDCCQEIGYVRDHARVCVSWLEQIHAQTQKKQGDMGQLPQI